MERDARGAVRKIGGDLGRDYELARTGVGHRARGLNEDDAPQRVAAAAALGPTVAELPSVGSGHGALRRRAEANDPAIARAARIELGVDGGRQRAQLHWSAVRHAETLVGRDVLGGSRVTVRGHRDLEGGPAGAEHERVRRRQLTAVHGAEGVRYGDRIARVRREYLRWREAKRHRVAPF